MGLPMADGFTAKVDLSDVLLRLDRLGDKGVSLASRMAVSGGREIRDEAKLQVTESDPPYNPISRGSQQPGTLRDAIYLAKNDDLTTASMIVYSISWNAKKAWWGKLKEFGWTQTHKIAYVEGADYFITTDELLAEPIRHPAQPFLASAYEISISRAYSAMIERGRKELPNLLREAQ